MLRLKAEVAGKVHGVNFRNFVVEKAGTLSLTGWVRNEPGGLVLVTAEGEEENLKKFERHLWAGPLFAKVETVRVEYHDATGEFNNFLKK